jgi:hypothetical protein
MTTVTRISPGLWHIGGHEIRRVTGRHTTPAAHGGGPDHNVHRLEATHRAEWWEIRSLDQPDGEPVHVAITLAAARTWLALSTEDVNL